MKKAAVFILITVMLLTSCARYLKIDFNKYTRVYLPGLSRSGISDSYDLYASEGSRFFRAGSRTYFFDSTSVDILGRISPSLAYLTKNSLEINYVCTDPDCVHNNRTDFTHRCILCDISDYRYTAFHEGKLYFARAKRDNGNGGYYYDQSDGTDYSEADMETFVLQEFYSSADEREVPWELIAYDLESGEYEILYSVPAESYLDRVIYLDGNLYFIETYYAERKNLINTGDDADWFYFTDTETGAEGVTRRARHFYTHLTFRREKTLYYSTQEKEPASTGGCLINIRDNRKYKIGDNKQLFEKVYALKSFDIESRTVNTVISELPTEPQELLGWDGRIFIADKEGIYFINGGSSDKVKLLLYSEEGIDFRSVSSLQFDQYSARLYFKNGGKINYVRVYDDRGVYAEVSVFTEVAAYQITSDGIYILTLDGSLAFVRWNEVNTVKHKFIYNTFFTEIPVCYFTVMEDSVYISTADLKDTKYYNYYKLKMEVTVTDYVTVEDPDTPGAGIQDYELNVITQKLIGERQTDPTDILSGEQ